MQLKKFCSLWFTVDKFVRHSVYDTFMITRYYYTGDDFSRKKRKEENKNEIFILLTPVNKY